MKWAPLHLLSSSIGLQIPLEPAGDAEAENMEFILSSIRLFIFLP